MGQRRGRRWWRLAVPVLASLAMVASATVPASASLAPSPTPGSDISWPQCGQGYPATPAFGIVGVNNGRPDTANPCLVSEYRWALASGTVELYMNTANPGAVAGVTSGSDAYRYGYAAARYAFTYATAHVSAGPGHLWWLDVETGNSWSSDQAANTADIAGSIAYLRSKNVMVGIYSTQYQWGVITGGASIPSVPNWVPGASSATQALSFCTAAQSFSGGPVLVTQYTTQFDYDRLCPGVSLPAPLAPPANGLTQLLDALLAWLSGK